MRDQCLISPYSDISELLDHESKGNDCRPKKPEMLNKFPLSVPNKI